MPAAIFVPASGASATLTAVAGASTASRPLAPCTTIGMRRVPGRRRNGTTFSASPAASPAPPAAPPSRSRRCRWRIKLARTSSRQSGPPSGSRACSARASAAAERQPHWQAPASASDPHWGQCSIVIFKLAAAAPKKESVPALPFARGRQLSIIVALATLCTAAAAQRVAALGTGQFSAPYVTFQADSQQAQNGVYLLSGHVEIDYG